MLMKIFVGLYIFSDNDGVWGRKESTIFLNSLGFYDEEKTWNMHPRDGFWGEDHLISAPNLERLYVRDDQFVVGVNCRTAKIGSHRLALPITRKLYENSVNGDFETECKDGVVVKADKLVLVNDAFFGALIHFKNSQSISDSPDLRVLKKQKISDSVKANSDPDKADLSDFSAPTVSRLVEFIYTGIADFPSSTACRF
jgi:hypothetical protein